MGPDRRSKTAGWADTGGLHPAPHHASRSRGIHGRNWLRIWFRLCGYLKWSISTARALKCQWGWVKVLGSWSSVRKN